MKYFREFIQRLQISEVFYINGTCLNPLLVEWMQIFWARTKTGHLATVRWLKIFLSDCRGLCAHGNRSRENIHSAPALGTDDETWFGWWRGLSGSSHLLVVSAWGSTAPDHVELVRYLVTRCFLNCGCETPWNAGIFPGPWTAPHTQFRVKPFSPLLLHFGQLIHSVISSSKKRQKFTGENLRVVFVKWVSKCWSDKTSNLNMSPWALGNCDGHFLLY